MWQRGKGEGRARKGWGPAQVWGSDIFDVYFQRFFLKKILHCSLAQDYIFAFLGAKGDAGFVTLKLCEGKITGFKWCRKHKDGQISSNITSFRPNMLKNALNLIKNVSLICSHIGKTKLSVHFKNKLWSWGIKLFVLPRWRNWCALKVAIIKFWLKI